MANSNLEDVIMRDTRANQPAAGAPGRLYFVTDENVTERDNGSAWESFGAAGAAAFTDLSDVPSSYSGQSGQVVAVNGSEDGLEFISFSSGATTVKVSGSDFSTGSTSLVDITGLSFSASANKIYEVDVLLLVTSDTGDGMRVGAAYSAAGSSITLLWLGSNSANSAFVGELETLNGLTSGVFASDATVPKMIFLKGTLKTGANAGTLTIKALKVTSGTATVYIGSRMTVTEL